jgi:hypothetical protein
VTAVASWLATADERRLAFPWHESRAIVYGLLSSAATVPLMALFNLAVGHDSALRTRPPDRNELLTRIGTALERGRLLIVPGWDLPRSASAPTGGAERPLTPDDRLAETLTGQRRDLSFEGQRYQLVPIDRWRERQRQASSSTDFRLLQPKEARSVISRLSESGQVSASDRLLWKQALERLFDGSVAKRSDEGVALLRYAPPVQRAMDEASAPPAPPARPRPRIAPTDWIELEIVYEDGTPFDEDCSLALPGGRVTTGPGDKNGVVRLEGIVPGSCAFSLPDAHADASSAGERA